MNSIDIQNAMFGPPLNGQSKGVEATIEFLKERAAHIESVKDRCDEELARCSEVIRTLRLFLGQDDITEEVRDAVETVFVQPSPTSKGTKIRKNTNPNTSSVVTGIHLDEWIYEWLKGKKAGFEFRGADLRAILMNKEFPNIQTFHVSRVLCILRDKGELTKEGSYWSKAKPKKTKTSVKKVKAQKRRTTTFRKDDLPQCASAGANKILKALHKMSNRKEGFTRKELFDTMDIDPVIFKNSMAHLISKKLVEMVDDSGGRLNKVYATSW